MKEFKACLKKDYLDQIRTKKFLSSCIIAVALALFVFLTFALATFINKMEDMPMFSEMFKLTYANSLLYFCSFMSVYFTILCILRLKGTISKERKEQRWMLPIASGVDNSKMVLSKIIVNVSALLLAIIIGCIVHFVGTVIFFDKAGLGFSDIFANYACLLLFSAFIFIATICIDAISNKPAVSALVPILFLMLSASILGSVVIKGRSLLNYTPWLLADANIFLAPKTFTSGEWICGIVSYIGILAVLIVLSLKVGENKKEK